MLLYEGFTTLDLTGPLEVLRRLPGETMPSQGADVRLVAKTLEPVQADTPSVRLLPTDVLTDVPRPDVLLVPGGFEGTVNAMYDREVLAWLREAHAHSTFTTSVCTGSLILGAAGILEGLSATTHWLAQDVLPRFGAAYVPERYVRAGKVVTAAGVSAGIDMALFLAGELKGSFVAEAIQLGMEYDPRPPFDAGSPGTAPPEASALFARMGERLEQLVNDRSQNIA